MTNINNNYPERFLLEEVEIIKLFSNSEGLLVDSTIIVVNDCAYAIDEDITFENDKDLESMLNIDPPNAEEDKEFENIEPFFQILKDHFPSARKTRINPQNRGHRLSIGSFDSKYKSYKINKKIQDFFGLLNKYKKEINDSQYRLRVKDGLLKYKSYIDSSLISNTIDISNIFRYQTEINHHMGGMFIVLTICHKEDTIITLPYTPKTLEEIESILDNIIKNKNTITI